MHSKTTKNYNIKNKTLYILYIIDIVLDTCNNFTKINLFVKYVSSSKTLALISLGLSCYVMHYNLL